MAPMPSMAALAHRTGDHAGLAEPAAARAAAEDLDRVALVHGLGQRHQRVARVRPRVEVHQGVLGDAPRNARTVGHDALDAAVGQVRDVVELGDVDAAGDGQSHEQLVAAAGSPVVLPLPDDVADGEHDLLAVAEHGGVDEVGDRLGVERGVAAGQHDRVVVAAVGCVQRHPGQVERGEQVGVAELGGEGDAEQVELPDRTVRVDGELRDVVIAHDLFHVGEHGVGALGEDPVALVEHLVQDLDALVRAGPPRRRRGT